MSETRADLDERVVLNGLDGATGRYLLPPLSREQLGRVAAKVDPDGELRQLLEDWKEGKEVRDPFRAPSCDVDDPTNLAETGWGVIFAEGTTPGMRRALEPLLELRRQQAGDFFFDLGYETSHTYQQFMSRVGIRSGARPVPEKLPYYLLLVGDPKKMPFRFQSELDVLYAVGRLHFDAEKPEDAEASYASYAQAVVAAEEGRKRRRQEISFFAVENPGDKGTFSTSGGLVEPLADVLRRARSAWKTTVIGPPDATRERLRLILNGPERPSILFTASHGVAFSKGEKLQDATQGALVCQDWAGPGHALDRDQYFAAGDVPDSADLSGLLAFHFACYSAGTPQFDDFGRIEESHAPAEIAPHPFVARLPQKLLAKGALAVIGHVDRAWTSSFSWNGEGGHVQVYSDVLKQLMDGLPIGWAMEAMGSYFSAMATSLHGMQDDRAFFRAEDYAIYGDLWRETNDARNFVVLGDPAVRLNFG